jgi:hypothetical protein
MHPNRALPDDNSPGPASSIHRRRRQRWLSLFYAFGLLMVFLLSLLLLPADTGVGKLLRGALAAC